jgi:hypothetical protein
MQTMTMHIKFWQLHCNVPIKTQKPNILAGIRTRDQEVTLMRARDDSGVMQSSTEKKDSVIST